MDFNVYTNRLKKVIKNRDRYLAFAVVLLCVVVLQSFVILKMVGRVRTIIVPAHFTQSFWVDKNDVSSSYIAEMTRYFASLYLSMTPESSDYQIKTVLQYVDPKHYGYIKAQLMDWADHLEKEHLSTVFFPAQVQVDISRLQANITGDLGFYVGKTRTNQDRLTYVIQYRYENGRLYLVSLEEIKENK